MPRKRTPRECGCGCGEMTAGGTYRPGHDGKHKSTLLARFDAGDEAAGEELVSLGLVSVWDWDPDYRNRLVEAAHEELTISHPMTLRQLCYRLISRNPPTLEPGEDSYTTLGGVLVKARKNGRIPWEWVEDRGRGPRGNRDTRHDRSDPAFAPEEEVATALSRLDRSPEWVAAVPDCIDVPVDSPDAVFDQLDALDLTVEPVDADDIDVLSSLKRHPALAEWSVERLERQIVESCTLPRYWGQRHVEVLVEKDALSRVFIEEMDLTSSVLNVGKGYDSWSSVRGMAERWGDGSDVTLLCFTDFDPSGEHMVESIAERVGFFGCHPKVVKVALTQEDLDRYDLHPFPTKEKDDRSKAFIEKYGEDLMAELDALTVTDLKERIRGAVGEATYDPEIAAERNRVQAERRAELKRRLDEVQTTDNRIATANAAIAEMRERLRSTTAVELAERVRTAASSPAASAVVDELRERVEVLREEMRQELLIAQTQTEAETEEAVEALRAYLAGDDNDEDE